MPSLHRLPNTDAALLAASAACGAFAPSVVAVVDSVSQCTASLRLRNLTLAFSVDGVGIGHAAFELRAHYVVSGAATSTTRRPCDLHDAIADCATLCTTATAHVDCDDVRVATASAPHVSQRFIAETLQSLLLSAHPPSPDTSGHGATVGVALRFVGCFARAPVRARQLSMMAAHERTAMLRWVSARVLFHGFDVAVRRVELPPPTIRVVRLGPITEQLVDTTPAIVRFKHGAASLSSRQDAGNGHLAPLLVALERLCLGRRATNQPSPFRHHDVQLGSNMYASAIVLHPPHGPQALITAEAVWAAVGELGLPAAYPAPTKAAPHCTVMRRQGDRQLQRAARPGCKAPPAPLVVAFVVHATPSCATTEEETPPQVLSCLREEKRAEALKTAASAWIRSGDVSPGQRLLVLRAVVKAIKSNLYRPSDGDGEVAGTTASDTDEDVLTAPSRRSVASVARLHGRAGTAGGSDPLAALTSGAASGYAYLTAGVAPPAVDATRTRVSAAAAVESAPVRRAAAVQERATDAAAADPARLSDLLAATVANRRDTLAASVATTGAAAATDVGRRATAAAAAATNAASLRPTLEMVQMVSAAAQWGGGRFLVGLADDGGSAARAIVVADQHGLSERVRLDRFAAESLDDAAHVRAHTLSPSVAVPSSLALAMERFRGRLEHWGFRVNRDNEDDDNGHACLVAVPALYIEGSWRVPSDPLRALRSAVEALAASCGEAPPPCLRQLLVDRSCRGAVMFGDVLSSGEAATLFRDSSNATQFDRCSHGRLTLAVAAALPRPSVAPPNPYQADLGGIQKS